MKKRMRSLNRRYAFLQDCDASEQGTVRFLLAERTRLGTKDRGEVEAVVQASEVGASVIVDDPWGRDLAQRYDLDLHGTIWVLLRLHELGLIAQPLRACFASLRERGIRLPWGTVNEILVSRGEEPLKP